MDLHHFEPDQFAALSVSVIRSFTHYHFSAIRWVHFERLNLDQIQAMADCDEDDMWPLESIFDFTEINVQEASPQHYRLYLKIFSSNTSGFLEQLSSQQIADLPLSFVGSIERYQLEPFNDEQIRAFTVEQIQHLGRRAQDYLNSRRSRSEPRGERGEQRTHDNSPFNAGPGFSATQRPKRDALIAMLRAIVSTRYTCTLPIGQVPNHAAMVQQYRLAMLAIHPDRGGDTEFAQNFNSAWDEYIAEYEVWGD
jgi:hypothetical protein